MKYFLSLLLLILANFTFAISQNNQPNYPHTSSGTVDIYYTVVIGSMQEISNAENLAKKAELKGFSTEILPFNKANILMNRVCVGKTKSRKEANQILRNIKSKLRISNAWILEVPVIVPLTEKEVEVIKQKNIEDEKQNLIDEKERIDAQKKFEQDRLKELKETEQKRLEALKKADEEQLNELKKAVQEKIELEKQKAEQERISAEKERIEAEKLAENEKMIAEQKRIEAEKLAETEKVLAEQKKIEAEKFAIQEKMKAEQQRVEAEKIAEQERLKAEQKRIEADKLAVNEKMIAEQQRIEAKKIAEQQRLEDEKLAEKEKMIAEQQRVETEKLAEQEKVLVEKKKMEAESTPKSEPKGMTTQLQTIDSAFVLEKKEIQPDKSLEINKKELTDQQKKDFIANFKSFIENLRNYEYAKANEFINPNNHLFIIYNETSKPTVREFPNFEKFFAVFSAFTNKGTSYDFSLDIDLLLKENIRFDEYPVFDCQTGSFSKKGQIASNVSGISLNFSQITENYYKSLNTVVSTELMERINKLDKLVNVSVISSNTGFIEGLYFGLIENKWYLLIIDLRIKCK